MTLRLADGERISDPQILTTRVVWTDNRDVVAPADGNWQNYTPVALYSAQIIYDPAVSTPYCLAGQAGMRNQNIYTAPVTAGVIVGAQGDSKIMGNADIPVGFAITLINTTNSTVYYQLSLDPRFLVANDGNVFASFVQNDVAAFIINGTPVSGPTASVIVAVAPLSTAARTVFATASLPYPLSGQVFDVLAT